ncbi:MAG: hypothetical protein EOO51_00100 [Flavobacterium sp.]|nr:MAG: hypothetical protein EOO51_00100 [Flavobacterium sp.]
MLPQLISHNADLLRLWEAGYDMEILGGQYLLVHQIPYLNSQREILYGSIACVLTPRTPSVLGPMQDHTVFFAGQTPCHADGRAYEEIIIANRPQQIGGNFTVNFHFSSKPRGSGVYPDFYEKVRTYAEILSAPAKAIDPTLTNRPKRKMIT